MKFTISGEHLKIFQRNKLIEFGDVLKNNEILLLKEGIDECLSKRENLTGELRDLWRKSNKISKLICHRRIGELVYQLVEERPVRMGYDTYLAPKDMEVREETSLKEASPLQDILCGVLFPLEDVKQDLVIEGIPALSLNMGNALFIHPEFSMPWHRLSHEGAIPFYLAVYTSRNSVYVHNSKDPHSRFLFSQGYAFGDKLKEEKNPIIFR